MKILIKPNPPQKIRRNKKSQQKTILVKFFSFWKNSFSLTKIENKNNFIIMNNIFS